MLNFGLLRESVTSAQAAAVEFPRFCDSGTWRKLNKRAKNKRSDLGEKKRISGEIKVKSTLHDRSEMSAPRKMHSQADRLGRTWEEKRTHMHTKSAEAHKSRMHARRSLASREMR